MSKSLLTFSMDVRSKRLGVFSGLANSSAACQEDRRENQASGRNQNNGAASLVSTRLQLLPLTATGHVSQRRPVRPTPLTDPDRPRPYIAQAEDRRIVEGRNQFSTFEIPFSTPIYPKNEPRNCCGRSQTSHFHLQLSYTKLIHDDSSH